MPKRFTETSKWSDSWFRELSIKMKAFWFYCLDNCDHAGVWQVDFGLASFCIGEHVTKKEVMAALNGRVLFFGSDKMLVTKFIRYQYGSLSPDCKMHKPVYASLTKHCLNYDNLKGIDTLSIGFETLQDKEQEKEKVKVLERVEENLDTKEKPEDAFERIRQSYPGKKKGFSQEWSNFERKNRKRLQEVLPLVEAGVERYKAEIASQGTEKRFIKHFSTWINQECWTEEPAKGVNGGTAPKNAKPTRQQQLGAQARKLNEILSGIDGQGQGVDYQDVYGVESTDARGGGVVGVPSQRMPTTLEGYTRELLG